MREGATADWVQAADGIIENINKNNNNRASERPAIEAITALGPERSPMTTSSTSSPSSLDDLEYELQEDGQPAAYIMRRKDVTEKFIRRQIGRTGSAVKVADLGEGMDQDSVKVQLCPPGENAAKTRRDVPRRAESEGAMRKSRKMGHPGSRPGCRTERGRSRERKIGGRKVAPGPKTNGGRGVRGRGDVGEMTIDHEVLRIGGGQPRDLQPDVEVFMEEAGQATDGIRANDVSVGAVPGGEGASANANANNNNSTNNPSDTSIGSETPGYRTRSKGPLSGGHRRGDRNSSTPNSRTGIKDHWAGPSGGEDEGEGSASKQEQRKDDAQRRRREREKQTSKNRGWTTRTLPGLPAVGEEPVEGQPQGDAEANVQWTAPGNPGPSGASHAQGSMDNSTECDG